MDMIKQACAHIRESDKDSLKRSLLLVLGSGWGEVVNELMEVDGSLDYKAIPGFPVSTVAGHGGRLYWGSIEGVPVYCMQGRHHYYEGYSMQEITFPVRVFASLGIKAVFLTNAAGGINKQFNVGGLMLISDHINLMGANPLRGDNMDEFGPRFPDMTNAWDTRLRQVISNAADQLGISLAEGTYLAVSGPSFETPAEIRAFAAMGADAVGMSTVPECIVANHSGLRVAGISCITNMAAHTGGDTLTHEEVSIAAEKAMQVIKPLIRTSIPLLQQQLEDV